MTESSLPNLRHFLMSPCQTKRKRRYQRKVRDTVKQFELSMVIGPLVFDRIHALLQKLRFIFMIRARKGQQQEII